MMIELKRYSWCHDEQKMIEDYLGAYVRQEEVLSLRNKLAKANERVEELQDALVDDAKAKAMLNKLAMENGELSIKASGNIFHVFCETFVETFKAAGATNYLVAEFNSEELGAFTVTMQRSEGLTVYQKLNEANERVRELEDRCSSHEKDMFRQCVFMEKTAEKLEQHREWQATASVLRRPTREARRAVNKFAIEKKVEALEDVLQSYVPAKFHPTTYAIQAFNDGVSHLFAHIQERIEQLRKEQE
ncbi:MAG: hypothetical protein MK214_16460 [Thalassotalea sp.]|nr:hypothetical protein [Thalassotalea sp.]